MNENSELYQEPNAFTEALEEHFTDTPAKALEMPAGELLFTDTPAKALEMPAGELLFTDTPAKALEMPAGELLFKQLNNGWLDEVPADLKKDEELRIRWLRQNTFEKYLIALIILDILVLNDRTSENIGNLDNGNLEARPPASADL